jgi:Protein of unknown function (DUF1573)
MKKALVTLSILFVSVALFAQTSQTSAPATQKKAEDYVKFPETSYSFGKIKQGTPVTHDFTFTNTSSQAVVIEYASASCGCTTPTWPQGAIAKGKTDKITAGFNAATPGVFTKPITVKLAGVDVPLQLTITGEVLTAEEFSKQEAAKKIGK